MNVVILKTRSETPQKERHNTPDEGGTSSSKLFLNLFNPEIIEDSRRCLDNVLKYKEIEVGCCRWVLKQDVLS